jgi:hypothetical protein
MKMKRSNQFLAILGFIMLFMMLFTHFNLVHAYQEIDLSDPFKNYISLQAKPYSVIKLSGSNGYPIELNYAEENGIKVLRSRTAHVQHKSHGDTLFISFTGASISKQQSKLSNTPPAIIIHRSTLPEIVVRDVHCRINDFDRDDMQISIQGNALTEIKDCHINTMKVKVSQQGHLEFLDQNRVDSLQLNMTNSSVAFLKNVNLDHIKENLGDSVSLVLSNQVFSSLVE